MKKTKQEEILISIILDTLGKNAADISSLLLGKKNVNEFIIAKKINLTINQTRNLLYKLSDLGLISFIRKKDKRKGWYTYFWTLNIEKSYSLLENILKKKIEDLNQAIKNREDKRFFYCKICKTEVTEETALLNEFTCKECGEVYELAENKKFISEIKSKLVKIQREYDSIKEEMDKVRDVESKKAERMQKKKGKRKIKKKVKKENKKRKKKL